MYPNAFPNHVSSVLFVILFYGMCLLEVLIWFRSNQGAQNRDKGSRKAGFLIILIMLFGMNYLLGHNEGITPQTYHWLTWIGFIVLIAGESFRWYAISTLGKFFTTTVQIHEEQRLIQSGPYRVLRHPSYTGGIIAFIGIAFSTNDWIVLLIFAIGVFIFYAYRIPVEEQALIERFGNDYREYQKHTWRLIPFVY